MKKILTTLVLLACCCCIALAQPKLRGSLDAVYLKDGSVLKGKVRAYEIGKILRLQLTPTSTVTIPGDQILKVVQALDNKKTKAPKEYGPLQFNGWYNTTSFYGLGGYFTDRFQMGLGVHNVFGRRWNQWIGTGIGVGFDNYLVEDRVSLIPVFVELKGQLSDKYLAPAYGIQAGYGFATNNEDWNIDEATGGIMLHGYFGLVKHTYEGNALSLDVGYRFQRLRYRQSFDWTRDFDQYKIMFKRLVVRFGFTF